MKELILLSILMVSFSTIASVKGNCVGDGYIPGKSKKYTEPLRASYEFDGSHIYIQIFGDDFDTMAIDYSYDQKSISKLGDQQKVIGKIMEPELLSMESEGSLEMKDLAVIEVLLPSETTPVGSISFLEYENKKKKGAVFKEMECEELD